MWFIYISVMYAIDTNRVIIYLFIGVYLCLNIFKKTLWLCYNNLKL